MNHIFNVSWGIRLATTVRNNGVINVGTVGLSNLPGEFLLHAVDPIPSESSRHAEQPDTASCLGAPPSMVLQQPGEGSCAVFVLGYSTVPRRKKRRTCSLLDTGTGKSLKDRI